MPAQAAAQVPESPRLRSIAVALAIGEQLSGSVALLGSQARVCAVRR